MEGDAAPTDISNVIRIPIADRRPVYIVLGPPSAGKSTLLQRIAAKWQLEVVEPAKLIGEAIQDPTDELGQQVISLLSVVSARKQMIFSLVVGFLDS
jgi:adenylate kinase family enzyme